MDGRPKRAVDSIMKGVSQDMNVTVWQVAAGDGSRDYSRVFLEFGVILVGPGSPGEYFSNRGIYDDVNHWAYMDYFPRFPEEMQIGDLVVLKRGHGYHWDIVAVGEVQSDYNYAEVFSDVEGWDLQHCRAVSWKTPRSPTVIGGLRRGTFYRVWQQSVINTALDIWKNGEAVNSQPPPEPVQAISDEELVDKLIEHGLPANDAETVTRAIWRIRRIARWYSVSGERVGEHEIRAFLIIPLLVALGWSEQKIKIEWNNIDVAVFDSPYKHGLAPLFIVESKRLWDGLLYAPPQVKSYSQKYPECSRFLVSDGIRYKLFAKDSKDSEVWRFDSYMSLLHLMTQHPYEHSVKGAADLLLSLLPI